MCVRDISDSPCQTLSDPVGKFWPSRCQDPARPSRGQTLSDPIRPCQVLSNPIRPNQTQSNPITPNHTQSDPSKLTQPDPIRPNQTLLTSVRHGLWQQNNWPRHLWSSSQVVPSSCGGLEKENRNAAQAHTSSEATHHMQEAYTPCKHSTTCRSLYAIVFRICTT